MAYTTRPSNVCSSIINGKMMRSMETNTLRPFLLLLLFSLPFDQRAVAQGNCHCPQTVYAGTTADTVFHLVDGRSIALCGYRDPQDSLPTFSGFILAACGGDSIIGFWGATSACRLQVAGDTLVVQELKMFPVGPHYAYAYLP